MKSWETSLFITFALPNGNGWKWKIKSADAVSEMEKAKRLHPDCSIELTKA